MRRPIYNLFKAFAVFFFLTACSINASSQDHVLYAIIGDSLASIDLNSGSATAIAPLTPSYNSFSALTYEPNLDQLLAVANHNTDPILISIDRCSGAVTEIDSIDIDKGGPNYIDIRLIEAMEYNPDDGLLYAAGHETPPTANYRSRRLMTVNPRTGNASCVRNDDNECILIPVGHNNEGTHEGEADGFAFLKDVQYVVDGEPNPIHLYEIDLTTGKATRYIGWNREMSGALAIHPTTGVLYSANRGERLLYTVSTTNATLIRVGTTHSSDDFEGGLVADLAFAPAFNCDCGEVVQDSEQLSGSCAQPGQYAYEFQLQNLSTTQTVTSVSIQNVQTAGYAVEQVVPGIGLNNEPHWTLNNSAPFHMAPIPPESPSDSQQPFEIIVSGPPPAEPTEVCFEIVYYSEAYECCRFEHCLILEPSVPCESAAVELIETEEECCYEIRLSNEYCEDYFTGIIMEIATPGVTFTSRDGGTDWTSTLSADEDQISWRHTNGALPTGQIGDLRFCVSSGNSALQTAPVVLIHWLANDPATGEEIIACTREETIACQSCLDFLVEEVVPNEDGTRAVHFSVTNRDDAQTATRLILEVKTPNIYFHQSSFPVNLPPGASFSGSFILHDLNMAPLPAGSAITFKAILENAEGWCCHLDDLSFAAPGASGCGELFDEEIACNPDGDRSYQGIVRNISNSIIDEVRFDFTSPPTMDANDQTINLGATAPGESGNFTLDLGQDGMAGETACFTLVLHEQGHDAAHTNCCRFEHCVTLPECAPTAEQSVESVCPCPEASQSLAEESFSITNGFFNIRILKPLGSLTACDQVVWQTSDNTIIGQTTGDERMIYSFPETGVYDVCMTVNRTQEDGTECRSDSACEQVTVGAPSSALFQVYPNPSDGRFNLQFTQETGLLRLRLYDLNQYLIKEWRIGGAENDRIAIDLGTVSDGIYLLEARGDKQVWVEKLVVRRW